MEDTQRKYFKQGMDKLRKGVEMIREGADDIRQAAMDEKEDSYRFVELGCTLINQMTSPVWQVYERFRQRYKP